MRTVVIREGEIEQCGVISANSDRKYLYLADYQDAAFLLELPQAA